MSDNTRALVRTALTIALIVMFNLFLSVTTAQASKLKQLWPDPTEIPQPAVISEIKGKIILKNVDYSKVKNDPDTLTNF